MLSFDRIFRTHRSFGTEFTQIIQSMYHNHYIQVKHTIFFYHMFNP